MEEKMSRWGVGPIFAALSIGYAMVILAISRHFHPIFQIGFLPNWFLSVLGIVLIVIGVPFFIISVKTVTRAYNTDKLVTNGIFRCCRHPLYARERGQSLNCELLLTQPINVGNCIP